MIKFPAGHQIPIATLEQVNQLWSTPMGSEERWGCCVNLLRGVARPEDWQTVWRECFAEWSSESQGPPPMWLPGEHELQESNLAMWMRELGHHSFAEFHRWSVTDRAGFWAAAVARLNIRFAVPPHQLVELDAGIEEPVWFPGACLSIVESCFEAPADQIAIVSGGSDGQLNYLSYGELHAKVQAVAGAIRKAGFCPGDPLAVVLPMTADSVAIYLGAIWAGCSIVSIADSFAAREISSRLRIGGAKAVFTYDEMERGGKRIPLFAKVAEASEIPVICLRHGDTLSVSLREQDIPYDEFFENGWAAPLELAHHGSPDDMINILFSSGTTGDPKAIPWTHTTPIKCAVDGYCHQDIQPGNVTCWPTNLGWMMGPFLIFATLINRGTIALYEDAPVGPGFGRFVQDARVQMLGVIPTLVKAWRASRDMEAWDWSRIHVYSSTGESSQPDDMFYLSSLAGMRPVIEYCGGTEIGGGYITSTVLQANMPSAFSTPAVGLDFVILDEAGNAANEGELFLIPPSLGLSTRLLNRDHRETYFGDTPRISVGVESASGSRIVQSMAGQGSGEDLILRRHGDHFRRLPKGGFVAGGRVDDTMNLGGIKVSSAELERVMNETDGVRETAAIALSTSGGPEELVVFAVCDRPLMAEQLLKEFNQRLKTELNPLFRAREVRVVESLPRTASNKVMRRKLRDLLVNG